MLAKFRSLPSLPFQCLYILLNFWHYPVIGVKALPLSSRNNEILTEMTEMIGDSCEMWIKFETCPCWIMLKMFKRKLPFHLRLTLTEGASFWGLVKPKRSLFSSAGNPVLSKRTHPMPPCTHLHGITGDGATHSRSLRWSKFRWSIAELALITHHLRCKPDGNFKRTQEQGEHGSQFLNLTLDPRNKKVQDIC